MIDLTTLRRTVLTIPAGVKIGAPQWSADGKTAALLPIGRIELKSCF